MKEIISLLTDMNKTVSTMESCTGGALASAITDIECASEIIKFSAVTYSNEFKIKMGVDAKVIDDYTVYSIQVANEMAKNISSFTNSNYGIGITGQLNRFDPHNMTKENNVVYITIYDRDNDKYNNIIIKVEAKSRRKNKDIIIAKIAETFKQILINEKESEKVLCITPKKNS